MNIPIITKTPSKFQLWFDNVVVNKDVEYLARIAWNACAKEAVKLARETKISNVDNKEDYLIGLLAQLKDPEI